MEHAILHPHIHAARVGDDLVLLDLAADDYLCLAECGSLRIKGARVFGDSRDLLRLAAEDLLVDPGAAATVERSAPPLRPTRGISAGFARPVRARPGPRDVAIFTAIWIDAARTRPTLLDLSRRFVGRSGRRDDAEAIAARVEVFRQLLPFAPWTGACLLQAELLLRFLNADGLDAYWVFGVRLWPFVAHCWLQVDDRCLTDAPETLTIYQPLMAF